MTDLTRDQLENIAWRKRAPRPARAAILQLLEENDNLIRSIKSRDKDQADNFFRNGTLLDFTPTIGNTRINI